MALTTTPRSMLVATTAALLLCAAAQAHESSRFGLHATIAASRIELTLTLPLICLRLSAHVIDELVAVSFMGLCNDCGTRGTRRTWS